MKRNQGGQYEMTGNGLAQNLRFCTRSSAKNASEWRSNMEYKNTWEFYKEEQLKEVDAFAQEYMKFLDNGKTERECIDQIVNRIEEEGYRELNAVISSGDKLAVGDKVYSV